MMKLVKIPLTDTEKSDKQEELVRTLNDLDQLEEHYEQLKDQHPATVKARKLTIKTLSHDLGHGFTMQKVACNQHINLARNVLITTRIDTNEVIEERCLNP